MSATVDGINYSLSGSNATVTGPTAGAATTTTLTIPSTITNLGTTYNVTAIGASAFQYYTNLTSITIPNGVLTIDNWAFFSCTNLASVTIGSSLTTIGEYAFRSCSSLASIIVDSANNNYSSLNNVLFNKAQSTLILYPNGLSSNTYTIPNSVTSIGINAFYNCSSLASVTIPSSVTTISNNAFEQCSSLASVTIPNGVLTIGSYAFKNCSSLASIIIPKSVLTIGSYAFRQCSILASVTIGSGVTSIGQGAFQNCSSLVSVTFMRDIPSIGSNNFTANTNDTAYYYPSANNTPELAASILGPIFTNVVILTPQAPSAPTINSVRVSSGQAVIAFTAGEDGGAPISGYQLSIDSGTNWFSVGTTTPIIVTGTSTSITAAGLTNGAIYTFLVRAINSVGASASVSSGSRLVAGLPSPPTINSVTVSSGQALIAFTPGADGGSAITNYEYSINNGTSWVTRYPVSITSPITVTGLSNGISYDFQIRAINSVGFSAGSSTVSKKVGSNNTSLSTFTVNGIAVTYNGMSIDLPFGTTSVTVVATSSYGADISISGATNLQTGSNILTVFVAAQDGIAINNYDVFLNVAAPSSDTSLSVFTVNGTAVTHNSIVNLPYGTTSVTVVATPRNGATKTITGATNLQTGSNNTLTVVVTAQDETTQQTYTVTLNVAQPSGNADLSVFTVNGIPVVNGSIINLPYGTTSVTVVATPADSNARLSIYTGYTNLVTGNNTLDVQVMPESNRRPRRFFVTLAVAGFTSAPTIDSVTVSSGQASIAFTPGENNGPAITNYEYSINNGTTWVTRSPLSIASPLVITGLTNGNPYTFQIRAVNSVGFSASVSSSSTLVDVLPGAPTINSINVSSGQAVINFTGTNNGSQISGYEYSIDNGSTWTPPILTISTAIINMTSATSGSITVTNLTNGTEYTFRIIAVNTMGNSIPSNSFSKLVDVAPGAPTINSVNVSSGQAVVAFTPGENNGSQISSYQYSKDNGSTWVSVGTSSPITVTTGLTNGTEYPFLVRAVNTIGAGQVSNLLNKKVRPTLLEAKAQNAVKADYITYGYQLQELVASALHTLPELKQNGYTLNDLKAHFTTDDLITSWIFTGSELKQEGLIQSGIDFFIIVIVFEGVFSVRRTYALNNTNKEVTRYNVWFEGLYSQNQLTSISI